MIALKANKSQCRIRVVSYSTIQGCRSQYAYSVNVCPNSVVVKKIFQFDKRMNGTCTMYQRIVFGKFVFDNFRPRSPILSYPFQSVKEEVKSTISESSKHSRPCRSVSVSTSGRTSPSRSTTPTIVRGDFSSSSSARDSGGRGGGLGACGNSRSASARTSTAKSRAERTNPDVRVEDIGATGLGQQSWGPQKW